LPRCLNVTGLDWDAPHERGVHQIKYKDKPSLKLTIGAFEVEIHQWANTGFDRETSFLTERNLTPGRANCVMRLTDTLRRRPQLARYASLLHFSEVLDAVKQDRDVIARNTRVTGATLPNL
jgi:hypothetical protein